MHGVRLRGQPPWYPDVSGSHLPQRLEPFSCTALSKPWGRLLEDMSSTLLLTESLNLWELCVLRREGHGKVSEHEGR